MGCWTDGCRRPFIHPYGANITAVPAKPKVWVHTSVRAIWYGPLTPFVECISDTSLAISHFCTADIGWDNWAQLYSLTVRWYHTLYHVWRNTHLILMRTFLGYCWQTQKWYYIYSLPQPSGTQWALEFGTTERKDPSSFQILGTVGELINENGIMVRWKCRKRCPNYWYLVANRN